MVKYKEILECSDEMLKFGTLCANKAKWGRHKRKSTADTAMRTIQHLQENILKA